MQFEDYGNYLIYALVKKFAETIKNGFLDGSRVYPTKKRSVGIRVFYIIPNLPIAF